MSLADELQAQALRSAAEATPEVAAQRKAAVAAVTALVGDQVTSVGDVAPDFELPDAAGGLVRLSELAAGGPVVVSFYRGGWCPYCNIELRALQEALPAITAAGGALVAISPEAPDLSLSTAEKENLDFAVLSDTTAATIDAYGLNFTIDSTTRDVLSGEEAERALAEGVETEVLPIPATYVIGADRRVTYAFVDPDHKHRAEPADIVAAVRALAE
ncbi:peroxiredoxin-like family protein [Demequina aurantiaca]|uniref:peroxiredoxin-like family protein n=1 Tax=Demequina aurantiaca TaxID=676200 RepID=UPI003D341A49